MQQPPSKDGDWRRPQAYGELQKRINGLKPGDTLVLNESSYDGPIFINTPNVVIKGLSDKTKIVGKGEATVVIVTANNVSIENLTIENSGLSHDQVDAGISIRNAQNVSVRKVSIRDCLFGIDVSGSDAVTLSENFISSKNMSLGLRGDAFRVFSSRNVIIDNNEWHDTRDAVVWYSENVRFTRNTGTNSRYSIHSMFSKNLLIESNNFRHNTVGIFIMYGELTTVNKNSVSHSIGPTGLGLGMKETSSLYAQGNAFIYCGNGILVDNSPMSPTSKNWFFKNNLAFNSVGVMFSNAKDGNVFQHNTFKGNLVDVDTESRRTSESSWDGNTWDKYEGFDRDGDNVGDHPYKIYKYPDIFSINHPSAKFFNGSPVLMLISLVERLLPISNPMLVALDRKPQLIRNTK